MYFRFAFCKTYFEKESKNKLENICLMKSKFMGNDAQLCIIIAINNIIILIIILTFYYRSMRTMIIFIAQLLLTCILEI